MGTEFATILPAALLVLFVLATVVACLVGLRHARMQSSTIRRSTNTSEEGINLNPSISGDGRIIGFESTEDVAAAGGTDHFRAIRANITGDPPGFFQIAGSRLVAPAISQDGSRIAFASRDDLLGTNSDGNSEIFLFDGAKLVQVTNTSPGSLANRITNVAGASVVLLAGYICYANEAKIDILGVDSKLIEENGAVSEPVARAMAEGARSRARSTYGLATTGIAGPTGGSKEKPAGTVYIALASPDENTIVKKRFFPSERETFKQLAAQAAFELLRRKLIR